MNKRFKSTIAAVSATAVLLAAAVLPITASASNANNWNSFRGNEENVAVTSANVPLSAENAAQQWTYKLKESTDWSTSVSDPIIINDSIYIAVGSTLQQISTDGTLKNSAALPSSIGYTCRLAADTNAVFVPLDGGAVTALSLEDLSVKWTSDPITITNESGEAQAQQAQCTTTVDGDRLYIATACADWSTTYNGAVKCLNTADGTTKWQYTNNSKGYYWSGGTVTDNAFIIGGDDGILTSFNKETGSVISTVDLSAPIRSTVAFADSTVFCTTTNGTLHTALVNNEGALSEHQSLKFAASSTCTPAPYNGKVYVGGADENYAGVFAVIKTGELELEKTIATGADVKSSPLLYTDNNNQVTAFVTCNTNPGALYAVSETSAELSTLYTPSDDKQNYCMSSVSSSDNGTLYYTNDSGYLFAVKSTTEPATTPQTEPQTEPQTSPETTTPATSPSTQSATVVETSSSTTPQSTQSATTAATTSSGTVKTADSGSSTTNSSSGTVNTADQNIMNILAVLGVSLCSVLTIVFFKKKYCVK